MAALDVNPAPPKSIWHFPQGIDIMALPVWCNYSSHMIIVRNEGEKMRRVYYWFTKREKWLFVLFCFSLIFCFIQTVLLSDIPEIIRYGAKIGNYFSAIFYSYIASYVFYYVALRVDRNNKKSYHHNAVRIIKKMINIYESNLKEMGGKTDLPYASESEILTLLSTVNPKDEAVPYCTLDMITGKLVQRHYTWAGYILENNEKMRNLYSQVLPFTTVIDTRLIDALSEIMDSTYFISCDTILANIYAFSNNNFAAFGKLFTEMTAKMCSLKTLLLDIEKLYNIK